MKQEVVILGGQTIDQKKKLSWCETEMQKYMPLVKQNVMKFEVFILGGQRIDQKRNKGWWRGSRERIEESTKGNRVNNLKRRIRNIDTCFCLFPQGAFLLSSRLDSAIKRCSSEVVLKLSFQRSCSVKGLARRDY